MKSYCLIWYGIQNDKHVSISRNCDIKHHNISQALNCLKNLQVSSFYVMRHYVDVIF